MHRRQLPIVQPCHADWEAMHPVGASTRHCEQCSLHVHELDGMTEAQARALLAGSEQLCVRYRFDQAGHIRFADSGRLRAATVAVALLSGCAATATTPTTTPEDQLVFEDSEELDPSSLGPHVVGMVSGISWQELWMGIMLPPDPIPLFPEPLKLP